MSNKFPPDPDDQMPAKKSSQRLLLLLLLLIAFFAYLYFFTEVIKPRDSQSNQETISQEVVKKPLPPRPDQGMQPVPPAAKPAEPAVAAKPAAPEAKPATPTAPAPQARVAPRAPQAKPVAPAATAKEAKPAAKPAAVATAAVKPQTGVKKTAAAAPQKLKSAAKQAVAAYTLDINGEFAANELGGVLAKLKRAGVGQVEKTTEQKSEPMHRLFMADFADRNEALEELQRLKLAAPSAFMLKESGRHTVYAGSFLREEKAVAEQDRLLSKGVKLLVRSARTPVAVVRVRAGSFPDKASADRAVKKLKKAGLSAKVATIGK